MSDVVPFPGAIPVPEVHTECDEDEIHAEAFRDLEGHIGDCATMAPGDGSVVSTLVLTSAIYAR